MSFYTHNKPRLIEPDLYNKLIRKKHYFKLEQTINNNNKKTNIFEENDFLNSVINFLKNNWSFLLILSVLVFILVYRYNVIKEDLEMKKARKQYIDQLIMDNYRKEKRLELERKNDLKEDWIDETLKEYQEPESNDIKIQDYIETENFNQTDNIEVQAINQDSSFNNYFNSKMDHTFEPFYGNSSFAPF
jgi:predicted membrane protein